MASLLTGLTDQPNQELSIPLPDGTSASLSLSYWPQQNAWFFDLTWNGQTPSFELDGGRLVVFPNLLRSWKNVLPFGLALGTTTGLDPTGQEDFVNGVASLVLLNAADVATVESTWFVGN